MDQFITIPEKISVRGNLSKDVVEKIQSNINNNNKNDKKKFGVCGTLTYDEFMDKIKDQNGKCYVCLQEFKYDGGKWCDFFPSADRIDNKRMHSKDNVAIACLFCNIRGFKQNSEKKCGLCPGLNHSFNGEIRTKSELFRKLRNDYTHISVYLRNMNPNNECKYQHDEIVQKWINEFEIQKSLAANTPKPTPP